MSDRPRGLGEIVRAGGPVLTDGGIETRFLFDSSVRLDPDVGVATLVGDAAREPSLRRVYEGYLAAAGLRLPLIVGTPTFRASVRYTEHAGLGGRDAVRRLNTAAAAFLLDVRRSRRPQQTFVAGVLGPAGDAYLPQEALDARAGEAYHREQAEALAAAGVDLLFAPTFPAVEEAIGVSRAMAATGTDHVVSFVLDRDGSVLDGTPLPEAVARVDDVSAPLFYSLSCVHPSVAGRALALLSEGSAGGRVLEVKANAADLPPSQLVDLDRPVGDAPAPFAEQMVDLRNRFGLAVVGGCCGTDDRHMRALAGRLAA